MKLYIVVLALLTSSILIYSTVLPSNVAYGGDGVTESIKIFTAYDSILVRISLEGAPQIYQLFTELFGPIDPSISKLRISFVKTSEWRNSYTYFLDGVWYRGTGINYVPGTKSELTIYSDASPEALTESVNKLSDEFMLTYKYFYVDETGAIHYISPYSDLVFNSKLYSFIDNLKYAVARWTPVTRLPSFDYYNITILLDRSSGAGDLEVSYINFNKNGFRSLLGQVDWEPYTNDTNSVIMTIYSRYIILSEIPEYYNLTVIDSDSNYIVINTSVDPGLEDNPLDISMTINYPAVLITRDFNSTDFSPGSFVEVYLKVENIGGSIIDKILVSEDPWWLDADVDFVSGDTEASIVELGSGESKIIKYVVRIGNYSQDIFIGPAEARVLLPTNITLSYYSQSNYIHRGGGFIDSVLEIPSVSTKVGEELTYKVILRNLGTQSITNLIVGEYVIGTLDPGEERIIELSLSPTSPYDIIMPVETDISYFLNESQYVVATPTTYVVYIPSDIYAPSINASITYLDTDNSLNISLYIENVGLVDATDIIVTGVLGYLDGALEYVGGDFTLLGSALSIHGLALGVGDSLELSAEFEIKTDRPFIYPIFKVFVLGGDPKLELELGAEIYYNKSLNIDMLFYSDKMVTEYPFYVNISLVNNVGFSIFNYTVSIGGYSGGITIEYLRNNISVVGDGESVEIPIAVETDSAGTYYLNDLKASFILGGIIREYSLGGVNVTFVYGLKAIGELEPSRIDEGGEAKLYLRLSSDCIECIDNIKLIIVLPEGIVFEDGSRQVEKNIVLSGEAVDESFIIRGVEPGEYNVNITVSYMFNDKYLVVISNEDVGELSLSVEENLFMRYYIYFVVGLVLAIAVAIILRRIH